MSEMAPKSHTDGAVVSGAGARPSKVKDRPTVARHGRQRRRTGWAAALGIIAGGLASVLIAAGGVAALAAYELSNNFDQEAIAADAIALPPMVGPYEGGFDMLIVGSDTRAGQGGIGAGVGDSGELNDVTMLLHVPEDQKSAVLVSFPRDLMLPLPACKNGGPATAISVNSALFYGGLDCAVKMIEHNTGLTIEFAGLITFKGVIAMSNAVGGVDVCTTGPILDEYTGLKIRSAGTHTLQGRQALAFLRSRHGVGDGSDLSRISTQQVFLSSLVRKIKADETLEDPGMVYGLATAATKNMTLSRNLARLDVLASLALVLKDVPLDHIVMVQYPSTTGVTSPAYYAGKAAPVPALADRLFDAIRNDKAISLDGDSLDNGRDAVREGEAPDPGESPGADPSASPTPTESIDTTTIGGVKGQTAGQYSCAVPF